jgi:imidazolonepropionase-like amidohydrolase
MDTMLITADRLFDGTGTAAVLRPQLRIAAGKIDSARGTLSPPATCSAETHDFPGCTIIPGLIDTHVHLVFSARESREAVIAQVGSETEEQLFDRAQKNAELALRAGITTVRDCGGRGTIIQRLRDRIRTGELTGADIISCGVPITTTLGHCHWLGLVADTPEQVRQAAQKMLAEDADWLKVMATGGNMTYTSNPLTAQYDDDTLCLIADIGRQAGKYSAAHVLSRAALPGAVKAGYRTIEHCNWRIREDVYEFDPELARRMIDQKQFPGLTMSGITRRAFFPDLVKDKTVPAIRQMDLRFDTEIQMIDAGVPFTLHSDAGVPNTPIEQFGLALCCAAIELKLTPADVLTSVTRTAAEAINLPDRGTLTAGKRADLVIVEGNPLQDLACLAKVKAVMKAGQWVEKPQRHRDTEKAQSE